MKTEKWWCWEPAEEDESEGGWVAGTDPREAACEYVGMWSACTVPSRNEIKARGADGCVFRVVVQTQHIATECTPMNDI